ncbi:MAG: glycogen(starch) synthase [Paraglaciecola sp.]|jgi:glycogen(starch) synthase
MLGWEYPPVISGGLGIASQGLAKALAKDNHRVTFLMPKNTGKETKDGVTILDASKIIADPTLWTDSVLTEEKLSFMEIGSRLVPYIGQEIFIKEREKTITIKTDTIDPAFELLSSINLQGGYGDNLLQEVDKYAIIATQIAKKHAYDIVHCHDWMTFEAGKMIRQMTDIPVIFHFHSTEIERNGSFAHPEIIAREKSVQSIKDSSIAAVSNTTKKILTESYGFPSKNISVVPNGYERLAAPKTPEPSSVKKVGFVGRFVHQKDPLKFLDIARQICSKRSDVSFEMVGDGHLMEAIREQITGSNLEGKVMLKGFVSHEEAIASIRDFDILVVPSRSEPFGLVPLEGVSMGIPVLVSQGCGITEFIPSMQALAHWDAYNWVNELETLLDDELKAKTYVDSCTEEIKKLTWHSSAKLMSKLYAKMQKL